MAGRPAGSRASVPPTPSGKPGRYRSVCGPRRAFHPWSAPCSRADRVTRDYREPRPRRWCKWNAAGLGALDDVVGGQHAGIVVAVGEDDNDFLPGAIGEVVVHTQQGVVECGGSGGVGPQDGAFGGDLVGRERL